MLPQLAQGDANKIFVIPSEFSQALGGLAERFSADRHARTPPRAVSFDEYAERAHDAAGATTSSSSSSETHATLDRAADAHRRRSRAGCSSSLVCLTQPQLVLEIGTYSGYSALSMARALPPDGRIITLEADPEHAAFARRHIERHGRIAVREGPALETIAALDGPFDLVFIDADKDGYVDYYEAVLPKLAPRGLIVADNTLGHERSEASRASTSTSPPTRARSRSFLTVRDGVTLIRGLDWTAVFDALSEKLQQTLADVRQRGTLTEDDVNAAMREIRLALLEADVNFKVVREFTKTVKERALGEEVVGAAQPRPAGRQDRQRGAHHAHGRRGRRASRSRRGRRR